MPTQEELDRRTEEVRELRRRLNDVEAGREEDAAERSREIKMQRLEQEARRLEARLDAAKTRNKQQGTSDEVTQEELYERAQQLDIEGRSTMDKDELQKAVAAAERTRATAPPRPTVTGTSSNPAEKE